MSMNSTTKNRRIKQTGVVIIALVLICIIGFCAIKRQADRSSISSQGENVNEATFGSMTEVFKDQIKSYLEEYFKSEDLGYITDEDIATISAEITTGVLNSLPESGVTDADWETIREFVTSAVTEKAIELNTGKAETTSSDVVSDELKAYIKETIVPSITAEYQIYSNTVEDLKNSLKSLSVEYSKNMAMYDTLIDSIQNKLNHISSSGATKEELLSLYADIENLQKILDGYKSETSTNITTINNEMTNVRYTMDDMQSSLNTYKTETSTNISNINKSLDSYKTETSNNISNINNAMTNLQTKIDTQLNGCVIEYGDDGHFYITTEDGSVSKKLDFAQ